MTTVSAQALYKLRQKSWEGTPEEKSLGATSKTDIEGVDVTCWGRLFQVRATATGSKSQVKKLSVYANALEALRRPLMTFGQIAGSSI